MISIIYILSDKEKEYFPPVIRELKKEISGETDFKLRNNNNPWHLQSLQQLALAINPRERIGFTCKYQTAGSSTKTLFYRKESAHDGALILVRVENRRRDRMFSPLSRKCMRNKLLPLLLCRCIHRARYFLPPTFLCRSTRKFKVQSWNICKVSRKKFMSRQWTR